MMKYYPRTMSAIVIVLLVGLLYTQEDDETSVLTQDTILNEIVYALDTLKPGEKILIDQEYITNNQLRYELVRKREEGFIVEVVTSDESPNNMFYAKMLAQDGIQVWIGKIHAKCALIGNLCFITSQNMSMIAGEHIEVGYVTKDATIINAYKEFHEDLKMVSIKMSPDGKLEGIPVVRIANAQKRGYREVPLNPLNPILVDSLHYNLTEYIKKTISELPPEGYRQEIEISTYLLDDDFIRRIALKSRELRSKNLGQVRVVLDVQNIDKIAMLEREGVEVYVYNADSSEWISNGMYPRLNHAKIINIIEIPDTPEKPTHYKTILLTANIVSTMQLKANCAIVIPNNEKVYNAVENVMLMIIKQSEYFYSSYQASELSQSQNQSQPEKKRLQSNDMSVDSKKVKL